MPVLGASSPHVSCPATWAGCKHAPSQLSPLLPTFPRPQDQEPTSLSHPHQVFQVLWGVPWPSNLRILCCLLLRIVCTCSLLTLSALRDSHTYSLLRLLSPARSQNVGGDFLRYQENREHKNATHTKKKGLCFSLWWRKILPLPFPDCLLRKGMNKYKIKYLNSRVEMAKRPKHK